MPVLADPHRTPLAPRRARAIAMPGRATAAFALVLAFGLAPRPARAQVARSDFWITNGTVSTEVLYGGSLYIGGSFTNVGPVVGSGVPVDTTSGAIATGFPQFDGQVTAVVPDGAGGWFVGGSFTLAGSAARANLAHVLADLSLDAWNPGADGQVNALVLQGGTLYAGGTFTTVGGQPRARLAAIDAATGSVTAWNPGANDAVRALAVSGGTLWAGGRFTSIGGATRNRIAALDLAGGTATAWNPGASLEVDALAERGGIVWAGGLFTTIGGAARNRIAALDSATGVPTSWNPNAGAQVSALALGSGSVFVGGAFTAIGGATRARIAEIDLGSGAATAWNPGANNGVGALALAGGTLYAGGDFTVLGGAARSRAGAIATAGGGVTAWNPAAYGSVQALAPAGARVFVGGTFGGVGGVTRNNLAALNLVTGAPTSWNPNVDGTVLALLRHGNTLYVGGSFASAGGLPRAAIAALDVTSGATLAWNPGCDGQVSALEQSGGDIFAGGAFTVIGGAARTNAASLDSTTGLATAWNPAPNSQVFKLLASNGVLYAGGSFTFIGGASRHYIAALDAVMGGATAWAPDPNGTVRDIAATCGAIYIGGFFTTVAGATRNGLAALDPVTGTPTAWAPNANGPVFCLQLDEGVLYAGGVLNVVGGLTRNRIAALSPVTGLATSWNPNCNGTVRAIAVGGGAVYAGGSFTAMGATSQCNVAALAADASSPCPAIAIAPARLADGTAGAPYAVTLSASGGTAPYCWSVVDGDLPAGLALSPSGTLAGTPLGAAARTLTVRATDYNGCTSDRTYTVDVFSGAVTSNIVADVSGLCLNPAHSYVTAPFVWTRSDSLPARAVSVTFKLDTTKVALRTPASPYGSITLGSWFDDAAMPMMQVTDNGGGTYTVDALVLGYPCGLTHGGTLFDVDLVATGADGLAKVTVLSTRARDCDNGSIPVAPGAPESLRVRETPLTITPPTLTGATAGTPYTLALGAPDGRAPLAFELVSGALPAGLALAADGTLSGTPVPGGRFTFGVRVTDADGSTGTAERTLTVGCPAIAVRPGLLPGGVTGVPWSQVLSTDAGSAPFTWSVTAGALPAGLTLSAGGTLSGTPSAAGTSTFTLTAADSAGCTGSRSYTVTVFAAPTTATIAAVTTGLCLGGRHTSASVPFVWTRTDSASARAFNVAFRLDTTRVKLRTPANPNASFEAGPWFGSLTTWANLAAVGDGSYVASISVMGLPCGSTLGGTLFTIDVVPVAASGTATIAVTAARVRDCLNAPIAVNAGSDGVLALGATAPDPVTGLAAATVATGNGGGSTTGIALTWSHAGDDTVRLYRAAYGGGYPAYTGAAPDSALAPGAPWTLVATGATSGYVDHPPARGFWYYVATATSACGDTSAVSNRTAGTLDYVLGDVSDGVTPGTGNNTVGMEDLSALGANYGIGAATIVARDVAWLDVGPTTDLGPASRPVPDHVIDFEDLMVFTANFATSAAAPARAFRAGASGAEAFRLGGPSLVEAGDLATVTLSLTAGGRMRGFSAKLGWDASVVSPVSMRSGRFVETQGGVLLPPGPGAVDGALTGDAALTGAGDIATFTFRALRRGDPAFGLARVLARDPANHPLPPDAIAGADAARPPAVTALLPAAPNPLHHSTTLAFALERAGPARLAIYAVDGRRVRTLADGPREPGVWRMVWDGRDERGAAVAPGVYWVRLTAAGRDYGSRLVVLR